MSDLTHTFDEKRGGVFSKISDLSYSAKSSLAAAGISFALLAGAVALGTSASDHNARGDSPQASAAQNFDLD